MPAYLLTRTRESRAVVQCETSLWQCEFLKAFQEQHKVMAAECHVSHTSLECVLFISFKGEECCCDTCSAQCYSSCEADKWSSRPSSPHCSQAPCREHEKARRLCLPWGLTLEDQGLQAYREDVCNPVDKM